MKIGEWRATHGNPHGSDHEFTPTDDGCAVVNEAYNVVKGLVKGRLVTALNAKRVDPRSPWTKEQMEESHDTNMWFLGKERFDTSMVPVEPKTEKKKKGKNRRHHL